MTNWISDIKRWARLISRLVLALLLMWFLAPDTIPNSLTSPDKISKPDFEQSQFSLDTAKQGAVKSTQKKVIYFLIRNTCLQLSWQRVHTAFTFIAVNDFIRNNIYGYTTIHAP